MSERKKTIAEMKKDSFYFKVMMRNAQRKKDPEAKKIVEKRFRDFINLKESTLPSVNIITDTVQHVNQEQ